MKITRILTTVLMVLVALPATELFAKKSAQSKKTYQTKTRKQTPDERAEQRKLAQQQREFEGRQKQRKKEWEAIKEKITTLAAQVMADPYTQTILKGYQEASCAYALYAGDYNSVAQYLLLQYALANPLLAKSVAAKFKSMVVNPLSLCMPSLASMDASGCFATELPMMVFFSKLTTLFGMQLPEEPTQ